MSILVTFMMVLVPMHSYENVPLVATVVVEIKFHVLLVVTGRLKKILVLIVMVLALVDFIVDQEVQIQQQKHVHHWV